MQKTIGRYSKIGCAVVVGMVINHCQIALAGWTGYINGVGFGWASANVRSSTFHSTKVTTPSFTGPNATIPLTNGYTYFTNSPSGASTNTYSRIRGLAGAVWTNTACAAVVGDGTDNPELEKRVTVLPADCAALTMDSRTNSFDGHSGTIAVTTKGTAGTALWLRGFEYDGAHGPIPDDDPATPDVNESIEFLKTYGVWKFETLMLGPFDFSTGCPLLIPFTLDSGDFSKLIFATDGVAKSNPLIFTCPSNITVQCSDTVVYPDVQHSGGCGTLAVSYSPPPGSLPLGSTVVTATGTDGIGDTATCNFTVTRVDTNTPVVTLNGSGQMTVECHGTFTDPGATASDACAGTSLSVTASGSVNANQAGDYTLTYTATGPTGNTGTATRIVHVVDTTPPTITCPAPITASTCGGSAQVSFTVTATDLCDGSLTPICTPPSGSLFPFGTTTVNCTATDGHTNSAACSFTVTVTGLTFTGFYAPISGTGGGCGGTQGQPLRTVTFGSILPIKFDIHCGTTLVTTGTPPKVEIQPYNACVAGTDIVNANADYQNVWHYNWDTTPYPKGIYKVIVTLPDTSVQYVFVKVK